jgi:hypothetical protein
VPRTRSRLGPGGLAGAIAAARTPATLLRRHPRTPATLRSSLATPPQLRGGFGSAARSTPGTALRVGRGSLESWLARTGLGDKVRTFPPLPSPQNLQPLLLTPTRLHPNLYLEQLDQLHMKLPSFRRQERTQAGSGKETLQSFDLLDDRIWATFHHLHRAGEKFSLFFACLDVGTRLAPKFP